MGDPGPPPPLQAGLRWQEVREPFSRGGLRRPAGAPPRPRTQWLLAARGDSPEDSQLSPDTRRPPSQTAGSHVSVEMQRREKADVKESSAAREAKMGATLEDSAAGMEASRKPSPHGGGRRRSLLRRPTGRQIRNDTKMQRFGSEGLPGSGWGRGCPRDVRERTPTHPHPRTRGLPGLGSSSEKRRLRAENTADGKAAAGPPPTGTRWLEPPTLCSPPHLRFYPETLLVSGLR